MGKVGLGVAVGVAVATCAVAAVMVGRRVRRRRRWKRVVAVLEEFEEACATHVGRLRQVVDAMAVEMHAGLASEGGSKLKMLLTFVDALPNGYNKYIVTYYVHLLYIYLYRALSCVSLIQFTDFLDKFLVNLSEKFHLA